MNDNELIAEFMGLTFKKEINGIKYYNVPVGHIESHNASMGDFAYRRRWDWLMPVVEKVEKIEGVRVIIKCSRCRILAGKKVFSCHTISKLNSMYRVVVEFIEWYNNQPKK